jgi:hypothetical protein
MDGPKRFPSGRDTSEFAMAVVPVVDSWIGRYTLGGGQATLLDEPARADLLASLSAKP